MFLPLFIAILLGLAYPSNTNNSNCNGGDTVYISSDDPGDGTGGDTGGNTGGETGIGDDGTGGGGTGGGPTTGENGHLPPPKP